MIIDRNFQIEPFVGNPIAIEYDLQDGNEHELESISRSVVSKGVDCVLAVLDAQDKKCKVSYCSSPLSVSK